LIAKICLQICDELTKMTSEMRITVGLAAMSRLSSICQWRNNMCSRTHVFFRNVPKLWLLAHISLS